MVHNLKKVLKNILFNREFKDFEADLIISHVTKMKKSDWFFKNSFSSDEIRKCIKFAKKIRNNFPIQYLIKSWEFYGVEIKVGKGVLIPRQDTETLVDVALKIVKKNNKILDLGTGSGCISAAIAKNKKDVKIFAVEKYKKAYRFAKKNLKPFKNNVKLIKGDILNKKFATNFKNFDLIVSNPPYLTKKELQSLQKEVEFEPKTSLYGGKNGLKYYEKISQIWKHSLKESAYLAFEIGCSQKEHVEKILSENGFLNIKAFVDQNNKNRVIIGKKQF